MTIREAITRLEECVDRCIAPEEYCQCVDFLEQQKRLAPFVPRIAWWDAMRLAEKTLSKENVLFFYLRSRGFSLW